MNPFDIGDYKCEFCGAPMTSSDTDGPVTELSMYCSRCGMSARLVFVAPGEPGPVHVHIPYSGWGGNGKQPVFRINGEDMIPYLPKPAPT